MPANPDANTPGHARFSLQHMRIELMRIEHYYNAYLRTGEPRYAKQASKLSKQLHKEFKGLSREVSVGEDDFLRMMQGGAQ